MSPRSALSSTPTGQNFEPIKKLVRRPNHFPRGIWNWLFYGVRGSGDSCAGVALLQKIGTYLALVVPLNWAVYAIIRAFLLHLIHLRIWGLGVQVPPGAPLLTPTRLRAPVSATETHPWAASHG
jgi:hypothetical protein